MSNTNYTLTINYNLSLQIGLENSVLLNQILFWLDRCGKKVEGMPGQWIYNSLEEWHKQFSFWSLSKLRRIIKSLEKQDLLISKKINSKKWNQTKWYSINLNKYNNLFDKDDLLDKKGTDRFVQNEQMLLKETKNNYTKKSSYKKKEEFLKINKPKRKVFKDSKVGEVTLSQKQKDIAKAMVQMWNDHFECSLSPVKAFANKHVVVQLNKILETKFENNLENWKLYARAVNSSKFLMGEKKTKSNFKAQFLWLIKEETIDSIQNGAYGVGDRILDSDKIEENLKVCQKEIQQMVQTKMKKKVQENISKATAEEEFKKYLLNREYIKDGDLYLVKKHMETIGSEYMYGGYITASHVFYPGNEKYKQRLFESYLMKKYYGVDETGISTSFDKLTNSDDEKSMLLKFKHIREKLKFRGLQDSNESFSLLGSIVKKVNNIPVVCMLN